MADSGILETHSPTGTLVRNLILLAFASSVAVLSSTLSVESLIGTVPAIVLVLAGTFIATLVFWEASHKPSSEESITSQAKSGSRRAFLAGAARLGLAVTLGGLMAHLPTPQRAEAACFGCESCGPEIIFAACSGQCCASFWVRDQEYCEPYCYPCTGWRLEQFCGVPDCC
jgi:hypothetical protein